MLRLAALIALALASCNKGSSGVPRPVPPPHTGVVTIDMNSWWAITEIERLDAPSIAPPGPDPLAQPFLSIQIGQTISIWQGEALDLGTGEPLYQSLSSGSPNERYLNVADGRYWIFDLLYEANIGCFSHTAIQAAFGTVDEWTLDGIVSVNHLTSCLVPAVVRPDPNGIYRVQMRKVAPSILEPKPEGRSEPDQGR